jgi:hypothetical protein
MEYKKLSSLLNLNTIAQDFSINVENISFSLRVQKSTQKTNIALFIFHGAVDHTQRTPPIFIGPFQQFSDSCHQVSIADPALEHGFPKELGLTWYAGYDGVDVQSISQKLCSEIAGLLGCSRVIFLGGSGGALPHCGFHTHFLTALPW